MFCIATCGGCCRIVSRLYAQALIAYWFPMLFGYMTGAELLPESTKSFILLQFGQVAEFRGTFRATTFRQSTGNPQGFSYIFVHVK